jgi:ketosteroid isomerase-like protein
MKTVLVGRRSFFWKAGAALSATLASAGVTAAARRDDTDDVRAIRALHRSFSDHLNERHHEELARLLTDDADVQLNGAVLLSQDVDAEVRVAPNGQTATARVSCRAQTEVAIDAPSSAVEMARQHGEGCTRSWQGGAFESVCVKAEGRWKIARLVYRASSNPAQGSAHEK